MKRIIILIVTLMGACGRLALAQETPPPSQYLKSVNAQFYMDTRDSAIWHFKGTPHGWERLGRYKDVTNKLNISDTTVLLKKATASSTYAKLIGGNAFTGDQTINGVMNVANAVVSNFHTGSFGGLSFAANPNITTSGKTAFNIISGSGTGGLRAKNDSLSAINGTLYVSSNINAENNTVKGGHFIAGDAGIRIKGIFYQGSFNGNSFALNEHLSGQRLIYGAGSGIQILAEDGYGDGSINLRAGPSNSMEITSLSTDIKNFLRISGAPISSPQQYFLMNNATAGGYGTYLVNASNFATSSSLVNYLSKSGDAMSGDLLLYSTTPTNPLSAAPKAYIDNLITGITWKNAVRAKTTSNIVLSGIQTIDGIAGLAGGRYLVNSQSDATQNGIWIMASGAWSRPADADSGDELLTSTVAVTGGTLNKNTQWTCLNTALPDIGTDAITYGQISGAGTYNSSSGVDLTGNTFTLNQAFVRSLFSASTGIVYNNSNGAFSLSSIPNNTLANSTVSGVPLGANLFSLNAGAGLIGTAYNGSVAQTWNINQAFSPLWSALHTHQINALGAVSTAAISLQNTTAAAFNAQQFSPALEFSSNGWETTGGTSQVTNWRILNTPQQGPASSSILTFQNSNNNSGIWATRLQLFPNILSLGGYYLSSRTNIGTTSTDAFFAQNTQAATSGAPVQYSPRLNFQGSAWNTSGTPSSNSINWTNEMRPTSGSTTGGSVVWAYSNNGGAFSDKMSLGADGYLTLGGGLIATRGNTGAVSLDGLYLLNGTPATSGVPVQNSTRINFQGAAWNTSGTPASNNINWINEMRPTSGSSTGGNMVWAYSNSGGAYNDRMTLDQNGNLSVSNYGGFSGGMGTSPTLNGGSNFSAIGGNSIGGISTFSNILPSGSTTLQNRVLMVGNTSSQLAANSSYSTLVIGKSPLTVAGTGTHPLLASVIFRSPSIGGTGATLPLAANVYIDDAPTGASNNYALYVASGAAYYGGTMQTNGRIRAVTTAKTANYSLATADDIIPTDSSAGTFNLSLPPTAQMGTVYTIDNGAATANAVTLIGTVNGVPNYVLNASKYITIYKTATSTNTWRIIGSN